MQFLRLGERTKPFADIIGLLSLIVGMTMLIIGTSTCMEGIWAFSTLLYRDKTILFDSEVSGNWLFPGIIIWNDLDEFYSGITDYCYICYHNPGSQRIDYPQLMYSIGLYVLVQVRMFKNFLCFNLWGCAPGQSTNLSWDEMKGNYIAIYPSKAFEDIVLNAFPWASKIGRNLPCRPPSSVD